MMDRILVLDVGGTFIKYGLADVSGRLLPGTVRQVPSHSEDSAEKFLDALRGILKEASAESAPKRAAVSICGPFDFDSGVSLMTHKFRALYGVSLRPPFEEAGVPVSFLHDATAFILGEYFDGTLKGADNACCVMLGTGLGFGWIKGGRVCVDATRTPAFSLWRTPYLGGIAEDYVSTRAIQRVYGQALPVKQIADAARAGDEKAKDAFRTAGEHLSRIIALIAPALGCEKLALGGQIARSADLFGLEISIPWTVTEHFEDGALRGCCAYALSGKDCEKTTDAPAITLPNE